MNKPSDIAYKRASHSDRLLIVKYSRQQLDQIDDVKSILQLTQINELKSSKLYRIA